MKVKFFCPKWGSENLSWLDFFKKAKAAGYDGAEMSLPFDAKEKKDILSMMTDLGLEYIAQHWETSDSNLEKHLQTYEKHLRNVAEAKPLFINSQTGKDFFSFEQNKVIIEKATRISQETGVKIVHETHRGKFNFCTSATKIYLEAFPELRIAADFSHWCNVAETYLQDQKEIMALAISRTDHIHSRVGCPEAPQITDPRAPEWKDALNHHIEWWDAIINAHKQKGTEVFTITPEFGPDPYMPSLPYTKQPVTNQWDVNCYMKDLLKERYN